MTIAIDINDVIRDNMFQFKTVYQKYIDGSFDIDLNDIDTYNMLDHYPFDDESALQQFKYVDFPFELYGRAETCDKMLSYALNDYLEKTLKDLDEVPNVILFYAPETQGESVDLFCVHLRRIARKRRGRLSSLRELCETAERTAGPDIFLGILFFLLKW